ncbi:Ankyrin [Lachnellula occidentalis]|uniref:Ankyrin n=1 Tax=Lachnellula occidentalis TaxID=215460 RepID=A0A8H8RK82_9HELO|nr:Ankyrin [Lachnellula occidentalis]
MFIVAAAADGNIEIIQIFLTYGIAVNLVVKEEIEYWKLPAIASVLRQPDLENQEMVKFKTTALATAVRSQNFELVKFISNKPDVDFSSTAIGYNLIHLAVAAFEGHNEDAIYDVVGLLLACGADHNEVTADGRGILHHFANYSSVHGSQFVKTLSFLIDSGCAVNAVDTSGNTPLHIFCSHLDRYSPSSRARAVRLFSGNGEVKSLQRDDGFLPLHLAIQQRLSSEIIQLLIPKEVSQTQWKDLSSTLLYQATRQLDEHGSTDIPERLRILEIVTGIEGFDLNIPSSDGMTALLSVARDAQQSSSSSTADILAVLLSKGADVNAITLDKRSALHFLAKSGFELGVLEIIRHNPIMDDLDQAGRTPLHWAIRNNHVNVVRLLLRHGKDRRAKDKLSIRVAAEQWTGDGYLPLHFASVRGRDAIISLMWEMGEFPDLNVRTRDEYTCTALHLAVCKGHIKVVEALIDFGAQIDCSNTIMDTPLHLAAYYGYHDIVRLLVAKGADIDSENKHRYTPWMCAALEGHTELKVFLMKCADEVRLERKVKQETLEPPGLSKPTETYDSLSKSKLETGAPNLKATTEIQQLSPIMSKAVQTNDTALCKRLLDCGFDPNGSMDEDASTALHMAFTCGSLDVIKFFLRSGARVDIANTNGEFPIHRAAKVNSTEIIKELVKAGADLFVRNHRMQTALHLAAAEEGLLDIIRTILEIVESNQIEAAIAHQPKILAIRPNDPETDQIQTTREVHLASLKKLLEAKDDQRRTPLVCAIEYENLAVAKCLAEHGANVATKSIWSSDEPVLWLAGVFSDKAFIGILLSQGLDVNSSSSHGMTCLHFVAERENTNEEELIALAVFLIQKGAGLSSKNVTLTSPLHCASHAGNNGLVKMFLEKLPKDEIDVNSRNYGTPLFAASFRGRVEVVQILLEAGADVNIDWEGQTPLEAAQEGGHEEVATLLLDHQRIEETQDLSTLSV